MKSITSALLAVMLFVSLFVTMPSRAAEMHGQTLPDTLRRFDTTYRLSGCGLREFLFMDIYLLAIYLPEQGHTLSEIQGNTIGRIFLLDVLYEGNLPDDIPGLWREPLAEEISAELLEILQEQYDRVDSGDRVEIAYQPDQGEVLRINGEVVIRDQGRELMPALTDLWLGDDPVSGNLKRLLLNGQCS